MKLLEYYQFYRKHSPLSNSKPMGLGNIVKKVREFDIQHHVHNWRKLIMSLAREKIKSS